ncbi:phosphotransferase enzyme family protein [Mycobacterium kansasii]|uniref:non-specific serine/threonine protein kinase n=1 Tax=Mycobacterium kansasii TaxID=1768 RepID=A0A1V3XTS4_MYCKA|nr:phosphotransferase enzyme family protein [Mycobacterium kansasii]
MLSRRRLPSRNGVGRRRDLCRLHNRATSGVGPDRRGLSRRGPTLGAVGGAESSLAGPVVGPEFRRRFHRETAVAANLYHPNIVEVHERGEFEGRLWIAMDYIDGISAAQLMRERFPAVLPVGEVLAIISATAAALDYAHQRAVLHGDVKPANILVTSAGRVSRGSC